MQYLLFKLFRIELRNSSEGKIFDRRNSLNAISFFQASEIKANATKKLFDTKGTCCCLRGQGRSRHQDLYDNVGKINSPINGKVSKSKKGVQTF